MTGDATEDGGGGTYFVDHDGHYYYQSETADGQQVMTVVSGKYCVIEVYLYSFPIVDEELF